MVGNTEMADHRCDQNNNPEPRVVGDDLANIASTLASFKSYHFARKSDDAGDISKRSTATEDQYSVEHPGPKHDTSTTMKPTCETNLATATLPGGRKGIDISSLQNQPRDNGIQIAAPVVNSLSVANQDRREDVGKIGKSRRKAHARKEAEIERAKEYATSLSLSRSIYKTDAALSLHSPVQSYRSAVPTEAKSPTIAHSQLDNDALNKQVANNTPGGSGGTVVSSTINSESPKHISTQRSVKRSLQEDDVSGKSLVESHAADHRSKKKARNESIASSAPVISPGPTKRNKMKDTNKDTTRNRQFDTFPPDSVDGGTAGAISHTDVTPSGQLPITSENSLRNRSTAKKRAEDSINNEMLGVEMLLRKQFEAHSTALKVLPPKQVHADLNSHSQSQPRDESNRTRPQREHIEQQQNIKVKANSSSDVPAMGHSEILRLVHELQKGTPSVSKDKFDSTSERQQDSKISRLVGVPISQTSEGSNRSRNLQQKVPTTSSQPTPPTRNHNDIRHKSSAAAALASVLQEKVTRTTAPTSLPFVNTGNSVSSPKGPPGMMNQQLLLNLIKQSNNSADSNVVPSVNLSTNKNSIMAQALIDSISKASHSRQNEPNQNIHDSGPHQQSLPLLSQLAALNETNIGSKPSDLTPPLSQLLSQLRSVVPNGVGPASNDISSLQRAYQQQQQQQQQKQPSDSIVTQMVLAQLGLGNAKEPKPPKVEHTGNEGEKVQQQLLHLQRLMQLSENRESENERKAPPLDNILRQHPILGQILQNQVRAQQQHNEAHSANHFTQTENPLMQLLQSPAAVPSRSAAPAPLDNNNVFSNLLVQALLQKQQQQQQQLQQQRTFPPQTRTEQQPIQSPQIPFSNPSHLQHQFPPPTLPSSFLGRSLPQQQRQQPQAGQQPQQQPTTPLNLLEALLRAQYQG